MGVRVGLVGLGAMGEPMAANLQRALPEPVRIASRRRESARALEAAGALWCETPRALATQSDVVVVMVRDSAQIDAVTFGPDGLTAGADHALVVVVASSVSPTDVRALAERTRDETRGALTVIDAPVSGGVEGARAATLSILVGGADADVATALPVLDRLGTPAHLGPLGAGQVAKACNQLIVASTAVALCEAAAVAERQGLDLAAMFGALEGGYAGSNLLRVKAPQLAAHDHAPRGPAGFMVKDLAIAAEAAGELALPQLAALRAVFDAVVEAGLGDDDVTVVQEWLTRRSG